MAWGHGRGYGTAGSPSRRTRKQLEFHENLLKGQTAQLVVERLFAAHRYKIRGYGIETRYPGWLHDPAIEHSAAYNQVRAAPDFIVEIPNRDDGRKRLYYLEVKFNRTGSPWRSKLRKYRDFKDTILIAVGIGSIRAHFIDKYLDDTPLVPIDEFAPLRLKPEYVHHFERIAGQLFHWGWADEAPEPRRCSSGRPRIQT